MIAKKSNEKSKYRLNHSTSSNFFRLQTLNAKTQFSIGKEKRDSSVMGLYKNRNMITQSSCNLKSKQKRGKKQKTKIKVKQELRKVTQALKIRKDCDLMDECFLQTIQKGVKSQQIKDFLTQIKRSLGNKENMRQQKIMVGESEKDNRKKSPKPKAQVCGLKIGEIKKENIVDYHDEFMEKSKDFSFSWRDKLMKQKRPHLK